MLKQYTLTELRLINGLTLEQLAGALGVSVATVFMYEQDSTYIPITLLKRYSAYFHIPMDNIWIGKDDERGGRRCS